VDRSSQRHTDGLAKKFSRSAINYVFDHIYVFLKKLHNFMGEKNLIV